MQKNREVVVLCKRKSHLKDQMKGVFFLQEQWNRGWSVMEAGFRHKTIKEHFIRCHCVT